MSDKKQLFSAWVWSSSIFFLLQTSGIWAGVRVWITACGGGSSDGCAVPLLLEESRGGKVTSSLHLRRRSWHLQLSDRWEDTNNPELLMRTTAGLKLPHTHTHRGVCVCVCGSGRVFRGYVHILSHSLLTVWEVNNFEFSKSDRWKFQQPPGSLNDCVQVHCSLWYYMACITWTGNTWRNMLLCASCIVLVSVGFTGICLCLLCKANCFFSRDIKSDLF